MRKPKKYLYILIISLLIGLLPLISCTAAEWKELKEEKVTPNGLWTLVLDCKVNAKTITYSTVYIKDAKGKKIISVATLKTDSKTIVIEPFPGTIKAGTYYAYVTTGVKQLDKKGSALPAAYRKKFTVTAADTKKADDSLRIATTLIQFEGDTSENILKNIDRLIDKTVKGCQPDMVVLSEILFQRRLTDVTQPSYEQGEVMPGVYTDFIAKEAVKYNVYIVFNLLEKCSDDKLRNCEAIMDRKGKIVGKYYKIHLPDAEIPYSEPGTDANVIDTEFGKIGLNVCYDLDPAFKQDVAAEQAKKGAKLIIVSSIGEYWKGAQYAADNNNVYAVISGQMEYFFYGTKNENDPISGIFGPDGKLLAGCDDPTAHGRLNNDEGGSYCYADIPLKDLIEDQK